MNLPLTKFDLRILLNVSGALKFLSHNTPRVCVFFNFIFVHFIISSTSFWARTLYFSALHVIFEMIITSTSQPKRTATEYIVLFNPPVVPSLQVLRSNFGTVESVELVPGGSKIPVTTDTRQDYVNAYVKYVLTDAVKEPFEAFASGFLRVCGGKVLVGGMLKDAVAIVYGRLSVSSSHLEIYPCSNLKK